MSSHNVVILAAGAQERFGGRKPKCLHEINGSSVLERLVEKLNMPATLVLHDGWRSKDIDEVERLGLSMVHMRRGAHIGGSIACGLRASRRDAPTIVVAADTYIPPDESLLIPPPGTAFFDPWQWITIYNVIATPSSAYHFEDECYNRVEYLGLGRLAVSIVKTNYVNVNDTLGLLTARVRERAAGSTRCL